MLTFLVEIKVLLCLIFLQTLKSAIGKSFPALIGNQRFMKFVKEAEFILKDELNIFPHIRKGVA